MLILIPKNRTYTRYHRNLYVRNRTRLMFWNFMINYQLIHKINHAITCTQLFAFNHIHGKQITFILHLYQYISAFFILVENRNQTTILYSNSKWKMPFIEPFIHLTNNQKWPHIKPKIHIRCGKYWCCWLKSNQLVINKQCYESFVLPLCQLAIAFWPNFKRSIWWVKWYKFVV